MLIKIENFGSDSVYNTSLIKSIENLMRAFSERKHIVIGPKKFFHSVIHDEKNYSSNARSAATEALRGQMEYTDLKNIVSFYITIDFFVLDKSIQWVSNGSTDVLRVGPLFFVDSENLQKANILLENQLDGDFYSLLANYFAREVNADNCELSYMPLNGGGGTTKNVFDRMISNNQVVLCILDNDKQHPKAPLGSTSKAFYRKKYVNTGAVKIIDVHEIESLIPLDTIESAISITEGRKKTLDFLKEMEKYDETIKFHFDHKKGLNIKKILELDALHGDYWVPVLKKNKITKGVECIKLGRCSCHEPCVALDGLGDCLLENTINYIKRGNLKRYRPKLNPAMENHWNDIGRLFFSWGCGPFKYSKVT